MNKKIVNYKILILFLLLINNINVIYPQDLQPIPELKERVTDLSGILSIEEKQKLASKLKSYEEQTTNQIAILIVPTTSPEAIEQYSMRVVEKWKLGQKGKNNGVLLLFAMQDRKMRIEVGYGLEENLPDAKASRIIREVIVPRFKERKFYEGIDLGVNAIIDVLSKGNFETPTQPKQRIQRQSNLRSELKQEVTFIFIFLFITYILFLFISQILSLQSILTSSLFFGGMSFIGGYFLKGLVWAIWLTVIGVIVFIVFEIIRRFAAYESSGGYYYSGGGFSSGYSHSSNSWGDSFSGGGGDFGGGGASGSWD